MMVFFHGLAHWKQMLYKYYTYSTADIFLISKVIFYLPGTVAHKSLETYQPC